MTDPLQTHLLDDPDRAERVALALLRLAGDVVRHKTRLDNAALSRLFVEAEHFRRELGTLLRDQDHGFTVPPPKPTPAPLPMDADWTPKRWRSRR